MKMTGAQAIMQALKNEGVEIIFGYPGGAVLALYDALYEANYPHILTRHEQGAIHAADGYARATGKVGVCFATSGPGATNIITGITTAYMDSIPIVAITGQVAVSLIGRDSFQEADVRGITTPITKHNYLVKDIKDLARVLKEAFYIAQTGRPGPVVVDIAKNVFAAELEFEYPEEVQLRGYRPIYQGDLKVMDDVYAEMQKAKKPLIFLGGGVTLSETSAEMRALIDQTGFPVISSLMGLGCIPDNHPQYLGMVGMHGTYAANLATTECDLLLGFGVRFDDRVTGLLAEFASKAKIVHFDIDPAEVNKNVIAQIKVIGDLRWSIPTLTEKLSQRSNNEWYGQITEWVEKVRTWKSEKPLTYEQRQGFVMPQDVIEKVSGMTEPSTIIVTDVGQHQMWASQFYKFKRPRTFLTSGGLGTMGYGLP
ncbi:MAG: biosynthetic-type acetolactate synthase large subunit, partial [Desulfitobacterium hafniense]|nr:biosynthetic-type acetolactate synthase large subunit [Desulfitobacterium hafniense]